ncbi:UvrD-helicase domain-containing protein [Actinomadura rupiterrae]|uniref:UvrD-helicase domain-containing protein n=1 Tax=Actinomadura rupiterrae TaxID=559627 RepID=UPI0020A5E0D7|nr:UvrD-helicase domain-containing protein [Actinomadura rupiterrae]MCP2336468.1 superfamily I DNA/RNA helicase/RecB family exonuclease [Actinomadura rupiterrae]
MRRAGPARTAAPALDERQRAVVDHAGGPLLVLAGPGTGKTTTIVEAVVDRIENRGTDPERVLVLTFSRKAAGELRERITGRLRRTTRTPLALTFHSYAYALLRRDAVLNDEPAPRLLTGPEQLLEVRRLLQGELMDGARGWPQRLHETLATRGFAEELRDFMLRAGERGVFPEDLDAIGRQRGRDDWAAIAGFMTRYVDRFALDPTPTFDYGELIHLAAGTLAEEEVRIRERDAYDVVFVDEYQDTDPAQEELLQYLAGDGRDLVVVGDPDQSIYGFRGADVRGILEFPQRFRTLDGAPAPVVALRTCRRMAPELLVASRRIARRLPAGTSLAAEHRALRHPSELTPTPTPAQTDGRSAAPPTQTDGRSVAPPAQTDGRSVAPSAQTGSRSVVPPAVQTDGRSAAPQAQTDGRSVAPQAQTDGRSAVASAQTDGRSAAASGQTDGRSGAASGRTDGRSGAVSGRAGGRSGGGAAGDEGIAGEVRAVIADSESQEAALVADELRRAHLLDGVPWSRMAVLVRSAVRQVPTLRRALAQAGVPVVVAGDEVPLVGEPAVRPFLLLLRAALKKDFLDEVVAEDLLTSTLGGADALAMRRLKRALRDLEEISGGRRELSELLVAAVNDPRELVLVHEKVRAPAERVARLVEVARQRAAEGASAEEVLWDVWQKSGQAEVLLEQSVRGGMRGASADRDLDAVVALFDAAARFVDRLPQAGPELFVDTVSAQEIAGDTLAESAPDGEAVRILTAHRSKGLEWDVVVVAGVQEGVWPDTRLRGSLLGIEELVEHVAGSQVPDEGAAAGASLSAKMMDEERRLFYVAVTRARRRLVVTAIGGDDTEERPSRFLNELLPGAIEQSQLDEKTRWLSLSALVADLRSVVADPARPAPMRRAAAGHLARLARAGVRGARPENWYAITALSDSGPAFAPDEQITISPSQVETFTTCGLRWLLTSAVGAQEGGPNEYSTMGKVVHAVAEMAGGDDGVTEVDVARRLDEIWNDLDFRSSWYSEKQREQAAAMVDKFLTWHNENPNEIVALEESFKVDLGRVVIKGRIDRAERDAEGRAVIIDIKTSTTAVGKGDLARHPQLGVYQYAVMLGAFERHGLVEPGGAKLVQVGKAAFANRVREQEQPPPSDDPDPEWPKKLVEIVATGMASEVFQARANDKCRTCPVRSCCPVHEEGGQVGP